MKTHGALIVDDEQDNIDLLRIHLSRHCPNIEVVGTATNVSEAIRKFIEFEPEILMLDIRLGTENAFQFLDSIESSKCEVVFVSSLREYGVKAVNYNATAFIVKPINVEDLKMAINKAVGNIHARNKDSQEKNLITQHKVEKYGYILAVPSTSKVDLIHVDYIVYAEADGRYTIFHLTNGTTKIASKNLGEYERQLDPNQFFRIHNSYIINLKHVIGINKKDGSYCELKNNIALPIAKRRQDALGKFLRIK